MRGDGNGVDEGEHLSETHNALIWEGSRKSKRITSEMKIFQVTVIILYLQYRLLQAVANHTIRCGYDRTMTTGIVLCAFRAFLNYAQYMCLYERV